MEVSQSNNPSHHLLSRLFKNSAFLLATDVITRATTFVLYALIARYLGAFQFGQLSLALTILFTFQILAPAGLRLLITREVANHREKTNLFLVNGSLIAVIFTMAAYLILWLVILILDYSAETTRVISIIALGLLPFSLSTICEAIFQGWEKMEYIAYANLPRNLSIILFGYLLLSRGYGLIAISWLLSLTYFIILFFEWIIVGVYISKPRMVIDFGFTQETTKTSLSFLGFQGAFAISSTVLIFMLSKFTGETEVGFYNASSQILTPLMLVLQSVVLSIFPAMCRKFESSIQGLKLLSDNLVELFLGMTFPVVVFIYYLSGEILVFLYGNQEFLYATIVLQILVLTLIPQAVTTIFGRILLAGHQEKKLFKIVMNCSVFSTGIGVFLIGQFGLVGAALTTVAFSLLNSYLHYRLTLQIINSPLPMSRLWKPIVASLVYVFFIILVEGWHPFLAALLGGILYLVVWISLNILAAGGFNQLTSKYKILWSESL